MNIIHRTRSRVLLSLPVEDVKVLEAALAENLSAQAQECLARLRKQMDERVVSAEDDILEVWADGASVQIRAITAYADPVDLGSEGARDYAERILACAREAD